MVAPKSARLSPSRCPREKGSRYGSEARRVTQPWLLQKKRGAGSGLPEAGDREMAARAVPFAEMVFEEVMPGAADEEAVAGRAESVGSIGENVAFVDIVEANFAGDEAGAVKRGRRSGRLIAKLEIGMKGGEVEGNVWAEMGEDPLGEFAGFGGIVVEGGDHKIGDFEPDGSFVLEPFESLQDGREVGERDFAVEIFREGFEVDVGGVDVVVDIVKGFAGDVAICDHDGFQAVGPGGFADVDDVLTPDRGFIVGEGDGVAAIFEGESGDVFGKQVARMNLIVVGFGDVPVLAEEAAHVAASSAHAEDAGAGKEMIEWLFLDRVNLESGGSAIAEVEEFSILIDADEAETGLAVTDVAVARAKIAMHAITWFAFPPERFVKGGGFLKDVQIGHGARPGRNSIRAWEPECCVSLGSLPYADPPLRAQKARPSAGITISGVAGRLGNVSHRRVNNLGIAHGSGEAILRGSSPSQKWFFMPELPLRSPKQKASSRVKPSLKTGTSICGGDRRRRRSLQQQESPSGVAALNAAALRGPVDEALELVAMPPAQSEEFSGIKVGGFLAKKGFQSPLDIRTLPRRKAIAARGNPVIAERPKHPTLPSGQGSLV